MRESKRLHEDSLPLKTRSRDGAAACVLVTPPPKNARRRRTRGEAGDEAVDEAIDDDENESDDDDDDDDALGADGVDAGEWVDVELRGVPSRWATRATASASEASQTNYSYAQSHASGPETSGEGRKKKKDSRARVFRDAGSARRARRGIVRSVLRRARRVARGEPGASSHGGDADDTAVDFVVVSGTRRAGRRRDGTSTERRNDVSAASFRA